MENWLDGITAAIGALWLGLLSWLGKRQVERIDRKADKSQLERMLSMLEKRDDQYREDRQKASESRGKMHEKLDAYMGKQDELNRQLTSAVSRIEGRLNGGSK